MLSRKIFLNISKRSWTDLVEKKDIPEYLEEVVQPLQVLQVLADVENVEQLLQDKGATTRAQQKRSLNIDG